MPTYTYQCSDCGVSFEQVQKFSDDPLTTCPSCSGTIRRVLHPVGVVFKGSGWYVTDSRTSSSATTPAPEAAKTEPATATASTSSDSSAPKPAESNVAD